MHPDFEPLDLAVGGVHFLNGPDFVRFQPIDFRLRLGECFRLGLQHCQIIDNRFADDGRSECYSRSLPPSCLT